MARVETPHGSFEAPDGWTLMEGLGAVGCTPDEMAAATSPHPSMVLTGDVRDEAVGPRGYVDAQLAALGTLLPDWRAIDESVPETEPGPAVVRHSFQPPDVGWMVQFQAYWFHEARVSILTMTTPSALIHQAWETFAAAVGTFSAAPPRPAQ